LYRVRSSSCGRLLMADRLESCMKACCCGWSSCSARFSYSRRRRARQQLWLPSCAPQHFNARLLQPQDTTAFTHDITADLHTTCAHNTNPWVCDLSDPIGALSPYPLYCIAHNLAWHRLHVCLHQVPGTRPHPPCKRSLWPCTAQNGKPQPNHNNQPRGYAATAGSKDAKAGETK
jgi:hypothetical protein